jgi:hypothetical protein
MAAPLSSRQLAKIVGITEREVEEHISHIIQFASPRSDPHCPDVGSSVSSNYKFQDCPECLTSSGLRSRKFRSGLDTIRPRTSAPVSTGSPNGQVSNVAPAPFPLEVAAPL